MSAAITGWSGCQVCSSARPSSRRVPPSGRLAQKLERALGGARIGVGEPDVGVDHADESQKREVVALGDQLGADDEVVGAARRRAELGAQGLDPAGKVRRQDQRTNVGKESRRLLGQPFDARPAGGEGVGLMAVGAEFRARLHVAAMMADERGAETVLDQPRGAIGTFEAMAARPAERQRRVAAPVEEQKRLLAPAPCLFHPGDCARRQPSPARRPLAPQIDGGDGGKRRLAKPGGSLSQR